MATATRETAPATPDTTEQAARLRIEKWLADHSADWELREINLSQIDQAESLRNQARSEPLIESTVLRYASEIENGDVFPPLVVFHRSRSKKYVTLDGNQRTAAFELAGKNTHPAYVVKDPSPRQVRVLTYTANKAHGAPNSDEDRLLHAAFLVEAEGETAVAAAREIGVSLEKLRHYLSRRATDQRLQNANVRGWTTLPGVTRDRLGNLRNDNAFREMALLAVEAEIPTVEVSSIVTSVNEKRTEEEQLKVIDAERAKRHVEIRERAGLKMPQVVRRINQITGSIMRLDAEALEQQELSAEYRDHLMERITEARDHLDTLRKSL